GPYTGNAAWALANPVTPNPAWAEDTLENVPIHYLVGENETSDPDRVSTAQNWVAAVASEYGVQVPLCIVKNGTHSSKKNHRTALVELFPELDNHPVFASHLECL